MPNLFKPQYFPWAVAFASAAVLLTALGFQYIGGLQPCVLCYYQRAPYGVAAVLCLVAGLMLRGGSSRSLKLFPALTLLCAAIFAVGAGIAVYHAGVEYKFWPGPDACSVIGQDATDIDALFKQLMQTKPVRCDEVAWSLFGISMAGYNVLLSVALAVFCIEAFLKNRRSGW